MRVSLLFKFTYIYLGLPFLIFLASWLKLEYAVIFSAVFGLAFYKALSGVKENEDKIFSNSAMGLIFIAAFLWCFFAGIGYFYYQSFDYHFRNAVFRDLINYEWPVFYDKANTPLVYYMGFWLIPAGLTKFFSLFPVDTEALFILGNVILFIYALFGIFFIFSHLCLAVRAKTKKEVLAAIILFIFFSGLDIIGHTYFLAYEPPFLFHLDWWAGFIQYSSLTTGLFWVFNQFIPSALIILLIYNEKRVATFGVLITLALFFAPYPTFGVGCFMVGYALYEGCKRCFDRSFWLEDIFSIPNIIGVFWLLPVVVSYFITNSEGMDGWRYIFDYTTPRQLIIFMFLEFLVYVIILAHRFYRDNFFITMLVLLVFIPFLRLDQQNNFCMRASLPALVMLGVFVICFEFESFKKRRYFIAGLLFIIYAIGTITPMMEFYRGIHYTLEAKKINLVKDEIYTLNQAYVRMPEFGWDANHQYTAKNYKYDFFWQYLSKRNTLQ